MIKSFGDKRTAAVFDGRMPAHMRLKSLNINEEARMGKVLHRDRLDGIDWSDVSTDERIGPVTPGDVLRHEFMAPMGLSARALARDMGVPANLVTGVLNGGRSITARTALLLAAKLGTSAEFWMNLQTAHDLEEARAGIRRAA